MKKILMNKKNIWVQNLNSSASLKYLSLIDKPFACLIVLNKNVNPIKRQEIVKSIISAAQKAGLELGATNVSGCMAVIRG